MKFEVGHIYKDKANNTYELLRRDKDFGIFRFNKIERRYRIVKYCGIEAVIQYGTPLIKAGEIKYIFDPDLDLPKEQKVVKLNNTERYIDVFKKNIIARQ